MTVVSPQSDGISPIEHSPIDQSFMQHATTSSSSNYFDSLPAEIASIVFIHYIHSDSEPREIKYHHPSLTLGKICRRWRQIAWSTPELWTKLAIRPKHVTNVELAEEWLSRSGTLPLSIELITHPDDWYRTWESVQQDCTEMLEVLSRHSERWHSLTLNVPSTCLEGMGALLRPPSALHHLSLTPEWDDWRDFRVPGYPRVPTFATCSPKVVKLSCVKVDLDWRLVTELTLHQVDSAQVLQVLQTATSVSKCTLSQVMDRGLNGATSTRHGPIVCQVLASLSISFDADHLDPLTTWIFCSRVSLPALKYLSLGGSRRNTIEPPIDDLILLLTQSSCALETLVVNLSEYNQSRLIWLLSLLPSLTALHISFCSRSNSWEEIHYEDIDMFYRYFADPSQVPMDFLPAFVSATETLLPSLEIFDCAGYKFHSWEAIVGLVKPISATGIPYHRPLKSVKIHCVETEEAQVPFIPKNVLQQLRGFEDTKFEFTVDLSWSEEGAIDWWKASMEGINDT